MIFNMFHGTVQPLAGAARTLMQLAEDGLLYPEFPNFTQPALIFHGSQDTSAPPELSEQFADDSPSPAEWENRARTAFSKLAKSQRDWLRRKLNETS